VIEARVQAGDFDPRAELARLEALGGGAVASFTGLVRGDGGLVALELEHYPGMTERVMRDVCADAMARWPLKGVVAIHRIGRLAPGARIVLAAAASPHRHAALEACAFLIDFLKVHATFWKREHFEGGAAQWVEARGADDAAAGRWQA
jgi:molybdopterin synthase catalytic subunit